VRVVPRLRSWCRGVRLSCVAAGTQTSRSTSPRLVTSEYSKKCYIDSQLKWSLGNTGATRRLEIVRDSQRPPISNCGSDLRFHWFPTSRNYSSVALSRRRRGFESRRGYRSEKGSSPAETLGGAPSAFPVETGWGNAGAHGATDRGCWGAVGRLSGRGQSRRRPRQAGHRTGGRRRPCPRATRPEDVARQWRGTRSCSLEARFVTCVAANTQPTKSAARTTFSTAPVSGVAIPTMNEIANTAITRISSTLTNRISMTMLWGYAERRRWHRRSTRQPFIGTVRVSGVGWT